MKDRMKDFNKGLLLTNVRAHKKQNPSPSNVLKVSVHDFSIDKRVKKTDKVQDYFRKHSYQHYIAIYDSFPGSKSAEHELIQRLVSICEKNHIGVFIITNDNIIQNTELKGISIQTIDRSHILFIMSLHFTTPKTTDHFTIMPLWNPIVYHSETAWENTFTMDGYLSAYSETIDEYVKERSQKPFLGHLTTSLSGPLFDYTTRAQRKIFYVGTNWEKSRNKVTDLIQQLDTRNLVKIYGPADSWKGYSCYQKPIPFDGKSIVHEIHKCGICLVLSSDAHIADGVCSNRLFEGIAAGVPIITDRNPFMEKWFGDSLFYIDTDLKLDSDLDSESEIEQIQRHVEYFRLYEEETRFKMEHARQIFLKHFMMEKQMLQIVENIKMYKNMNEGILSIRHVSGDFFGFFSNCSIRLFQIVTYINKFKKLPFPIDSSKLFRLYKDGSDRDITFDFFKDCQTKDAIDCHPFTHMDINCFQFDNYKKVPYDQIQPFIQKYFQPSAKIETIQYYLQDKYKIDTEKCIGLYYRGTDKHTETRIDSFSSYYEKLNEVSQREPDLQIVMQTDSKPFLDFIKESFPHAKNIIVIHENSTSSTLSGIHNEKTPAENFVDIQYLFATFLIMSKCKYFICSSGNCSIWMMFYRNRIEGVFQNLNLQWL